MGEMPGRTLRVLCLDDSAADVELTLEYLRRGGYEPEALRVDREADFQAALASDVFDVILLDYTVPGYRTLDALELALRIAPDTPCIGVSGTIGEEAAVEMIRNGARDYVLKDRLVRLPIVVERTLEAAKERRAREAAEIALDRSRDLFRAVIDATPDGVYVRDCDGRHLMVSRGALKRMGKSEEEVLGRDLEELFGPSHRDEAEQDRESIETGRVIVREHEMLLESGLSRTVQLTNGPLFDEHGAVYGVFGFARDITEGKRIEAELVRTNERLEALLRQLVAAMGRVVEARDPYTEGHERSVAAISRSLAEELGLDPGEVDGVELAALLHDIGKLSVPTEILTKPGRLSDLEFEVVKSHPTTGFEILSGIDFASPVAEIVLQHHERMDGSGYPRGLAGDQILPAARIIGVADVVEAISSHRPYRPSLGIEAAIEEITSRTTWYDPDVVAACLRLYDRGELGQRHTS